MTAKDKAKNLFDQYYTIVNDTMDIFKVKSSKIAKACALTAVDEILACYNWPSRELAYWQDVKTEISKL